MRKKLDTRFPAARIKKIMQADEDVGKIANAVPVLVSKALEMFLQDLCDRTYRITLDKGMKTVSSLHLKHCVRSFNHYDFLREIMSKVPDLGNTDGGSGEDRSTRRRKTAEEEENEEQAKRARIDAVPVPLPVPVDNASSSSTGASSGTVRGRGRGRPRGSRGRRGGARGTERDASYSHEDDPATSPQHADEAGPTTVASDSTKEENIASVRSFDLNMDLTENAPVPIENAPASVGPSAKTEPHLSEMTQEVKHEEYPGWSMDDMKKMKVDPVQFALAHQKVDEEDYDNEEEEDYDNKEG